MAKTSSTKPTSKPTQKKEIKKPRAKKASVLTSGIEQKKPSLRSIYANSKHTLMPLGFGSDFKTKKGIVIFSDLLTGLVHTTTLSLWNRMKLKEVKDINLKT